MSTKYLGRKLNAIEKSVFLYGINLFIEFEAENLKEDQVIAAVRLAKQKYPYLRAKILRDSDDDLIFAEQSADEINDIQLLWCLIKNDIEFEKWEIRFNTFAGINYDISKSVFNIEVCNNSKNSHQLFFSINQSGKLNQKLK